MCKPVVTNDRYVVCMILHNYLGECVPEFFTRPTVYRSRSEADAEALRMSDKHKKQFAVFRAVGYTEEITKPKFYMREV